MPQELGGMLALKKTVGRGCISLLQGKSCKKRRTPSIFSENSPCSVSFLLQHLEKAMGQLWVHIHHVPICFLGLSYKFLHSLRGFLRKLYTEWVSPLGSFFYFFRIFHLELDTFRHFNCDATKAGNTQCTCLCHNLSLWVSKLYREQTCLVKRRYSPISLYTMDASKIF